MKGAGRGLVVSDCDVQKQLYYLKYDNTGIYARMGAIFGPENKALMVKEMNFPILAVNRGQV